MPTENDQLKKESHQLLVKYFVKVDDLKTISGRAGMREALLTADSAENQWWQVVEWASTGRAVEKLLEEAALGADRKNWDSVAQEFRRLSDRYFPTPSASLAGPL